MTKKILDDSFCSKIWLAPIAHKQNKLGVEKFGLEMEFHAFDARTLAPLGTQYSTLKPQDILTQIALFEKTSLVRDEPTGEVIGVNLKNGGNFSLEPGGQLEYASTPCTTLRQLIDNLYEGFELLERVTDKTVLFLSHGTNPLTTATHPLVVPKKRYQFMTRYFESAPKNIRGIDMMRHSATVQPNLDIFESSDWHSGVNLILNLVPITSAMFANSKFFHGKKTKFYSERQNIWAHMDPTRSGIPTGILTSKGCPDTECAYAKWAKNAYVLFIDELPLSEQPLYGEITFDQWLKNGYKGIFPTISHWETHLTTLFPHLRLRNFLEIRNIDAQPFEHSLTPLVFFKTLLTHKPVQQKTEDILTKCVPPSKEVFDLNQNFDDIFLPLLDLCCEILLDQNDALGLTSLEAFKKFLLDRENYWFAASAEEFVKQKGTLYPAQEFIKYF